MKKLFKTKQIIAIILSLIFLSVLAACNEKEITENVSSLVTSLVTEVNSDNIISTNTLSTSLSSQKPAESSKNSSTASKNSNTSKKNSSKTTSNVSSKKPVQVVKTPKQIIIGRWTGSLDISPVLEDSNIFLEGEQIVSCVIEFTTNGTLIESIDKTSYHTILRKALLKSINNELAANQISKEDFEADLGMTIEEYIEQVINATASNLNMVSSYKFVDNELYVKEEGQSNFVQVNYTLTGENKLTIIDEGIKVDYTRVN